MNRLPQVNLWFILQLHANINKNLLFSGDVSTINLKNDQF